MAAEPSLHDDITQLSEGIRDLTERFSAKEELAEKAATLATTTKKIADRDRIFIVVVAIALAVVVALSGAAAFYGYQVATCQSRFSKATELRAALLTEYTVTRDEAMKGLVEARGLPNDPTIIAARNAWLTADAQLGEARELNPVPKYEHFCGNIPGVADPKVPPAVVPTSTPSPTTSSSPNARP
jgi:hypothetical protein